MKNRYEINAQAVCPVDGQLIDYRIQITLKDKNGYAFLKVEDLIEVIAGLTSKPVMQEPLTKQIAARYISAAPHVVVRTFATHSGVGIISTVRSRDMPFPRSSSEAFDHYRRMESDAGSVPRR